MVKGERKGGWYRALLKYNFGERYAVIRTCDGRSFELPSLATGLVDVKEMVMSLDGEIPAPSLDCIGNIIGMEVSVDASTGDDDAFNRLFGEVIEISESNGKPVLCVEIKEDNFHGNQVAEKDSRGDL
ncbi:hypothetical protein PCI56_01040 [Plesiomonas shigelloides subsp. oncorhynchi]|nr:hypothetical protein [Plesiomonas shigelloides]